MRDEKQCREASKHGQSHAASTSGPTATSGSVARCPHPPASNRARDTAATFIEYFSLSCPHCARHHKNVLPEIKKQFVETGKVKLVMRDLPLNAPDIQAALLAHCVSPLAYWGMTEQLFATQDQWVNENSGPILGSIAAAAGINGQDFQACLNDQSAKDRIIASAEQADKAYKVDSTPTFVVNGIVIKGERSFEEFKKIFDALAPAAN